MQYALLYLLILLTFSTPALAVREYTRPADTDIKAKLTPLQFYVTQTGGTEPEYKNPYWNNQAKGIYVDVVTGEPLFISNDKINVKSSGWPNFKKPLVAHHIETKPDVSQSSKPRLEVVSKIGQSHLGYLYQDGPLPSHERYCINSAALLFIPKDEMKQRGYGRFLYLLN